MADKIAAHITGGKQNFNFPEVQELAKIIDDNANSGLLLGFE